MASEMAIKITTGQSMPVMELPLEMKPADDRGRGWGYGDESQTLRGE
jgi:hypothetical protein